MGSSEKAGLPAFCMISTHEACRGLHRKIQTHIFTSIPCDQHARLRKFTKTPFYQHSTRYIPTIFAEGSNFESMLQKYRPKKRGSTKCCPGHAKSSSSSSSKSATLLRNRALRPENMTSMVQIHCACHIKCNPSSDSTLNALTPTEHCTCHVSDANSCFRPPKMHFMSENDRVKRPLRNRPDFAPGLRS